MSQVETPLSELAETINSELEAAEVKGIEHYRKAGEALLAAQEEVKKRGECWASWLIRHCPTVNERRARRYMALAKADVTSADFDEHQRRVMGNGNRPKMKGGRRRKKRRAIHLWFDAEQMDRYEKRTTALQKKLTMRTAEEIVLAALDACYATLPG